MWRAVEWIDRVRENDTIFEVFPGVRWMVPTVGFSAASQCRIRSVHGMYVALSMEQVQCYLYGHVSSAGRAEQCMREDGTKAAEKDGAGEVELQSSVDATIGQSGRWIVAGAWCRDWP